MKAFTLSLFLLLGTFAYAGESVLYSFQGGTDGSLPMAGLIADQNGNLYGTTLAGGTGPCTFNGFAGCGTVFELSPDGQGGWKETVIYQFSGGTDGEGPGASLILDSQGNLYGTAGYGTPCPPSCGSVFELSPSGKGWTFTALHSFQGGKDGGGVNGGVVRDSAGNIYGTTDQFGPKGFGTVFQLSKSGWKLKNLYAFADGTDGASPEGLLVLGSDGSIYGTTAAGGNPIKGRTYGVFYRLALNANGKWKEKALYSFKGGKDGMNPAYGLAADLKGNLYGVSYGGDFNGKRSWGNVFQFSQNPQGKWKKTTIYDFHGLKQGYGPTGPVVADQNGKVYGTVFGGSHENGALYKLTPPQSGNTWQESLIYSFKTHGDGSIPWGQPLLDAKGNLFGVTSEGGGTGCRGNGCGTVFKFTP